jgi:hypothetical protein
MIHDVHAHLEPTLQLQPRRTKPEPKGSKYLFRT